MSSGFPHQPAQQLARPEEARETGNEGYRDVIGPENFVQPDLTSRCTDFNRPRSQSTGRSGGPAV